MPVPRAIDFHLRDVSGTTGVTSGVELVRLELSRRGSGPSEMTPALPDRAGGPGWRTGLAVPPSVTVTVAGLGGSAARQQHGRHQQHQ